LFICHSQEGGNPEIVAGEAGHWIPAFAGMTIAAV
jgi:hypothetical protein